MNDEKKTIKGIATSSVIKALDTLTIIIRKTTDPNSKYIKKSIKLMLLVLMLLL
ncbi:variable large family protein [Borrelia crocidurae]|uniref:variable large family protein n=1 Tax=Borrelia crocidurae TaxID=29520 RepID=UPI003F4A0020